MPSLAKREAPVSFNQNFDPTKCLRNLLGMVGIFKNCRCNWCSLTSASSPLTKIFVRRKTLNHFGSFQPFDKKTVNSHCLDLQKENGLLSI